MESNQFLDGAHSAPKCLPSSCLVQSLQVKPDDCWIASRVKYHLYSTQNNARNVQTSPAEHCSNHICSGNFFQGRRNPEEFQNLVIRLGGFQIALHYLALIGKTSQESGLEDVFIESGLYGSSSTMAPLQGKSYNKGIRGHKLIMEELLHLKWDAFSSWVSKGGGVESKGKEFHF